MTSITGILDTIFAQAGETNKWTIKFFKKLFVLVFSIQGRVNFENLSRYSKFHECRFRRHFEKFFDWLEFNYWMFYLYGYTAAGAIIAAIDCSFIPKAGKKTFGLDKFWSGTASHNKRGLELSVLSLIDVFSERAWTLAYNLKLVEWLFEHRSKNAEFDQFHPHFHKVLDFGAIHST